MGTNTPETFYPIVDFSGAVQRKTTEEMHNANELELSINASYKRIGGIEKVKGYEQLGNTITSTTSTSTSSSTSTSTSTSTSSSTSSSTSTSSTTTMA